MPKVSVIVPIYNVEKYIAKCLDSLANQTLDDIQIILVNDGSTDNSGNIAKEFKENYSDRFIYVEKEDGGLSDARNYGMKYATGDYIAFIDSDDYAELNTYELLYNKAIEENADFVECNFIWEYPNKTRNDIRIPYKDKHEMLSVIRVVAWNKLIKKEIIINNNIDFPFGLRYEDTEFTYKLIPYIKKFAFVDETCIHYIQRSNSIANVQNERTAEIFTIFEHVFKYYKENNLYEEYKDELEYNYARYLLCSSLKRICKVEDKEKRKELVKKTWSLLNTNFPNWKKNRILNNVKMKKNTYMKTVNRFTYKIYAMIFHLL